MIPQMRAGYFAIVYANLCLALITPVLLHGADRDQPMRISARSVDLNEKTGVAIYRGNVALTQGEIRIQANLLKVHTRDRRTEFVHAVGKPAKLRHRAANGEEILVFAREVEYYPVRQQITLRGDVQVRQGQNTIRGSFVQYDLNAKSFKAQAGTNADERVTAVIYPDSSGEKGHSAP